MNYLGQEQAESLLEDADELCKILGTLQRTIKNRSSESKNSNKWFVIRD
jgi:hypothetical protein